jgi:DNA-binding beta-propeller fold protein YncE
MHPVSSLVSLFLLATFGLSTATHSTAQAQTGAVTNYTGFLATGLRIDPVGEAIDLGSMPLAMALAPGGEKVAVVLSGWREQGLQIVDLKSHHVLQTLPQEAAFFGIAFSRNGREIYVSGGNADAVYCYSWKDGVATIDRKIVLAEHKAGAPGSRYPAGLAVSRRGDYLYVAKT